MTDLRRPVYFTGADLISAHGVGIEAAAQACLQGLIRRQNVLLPNLVADISLPYCPMQDERAPYERLRAVVESALLQSGISDAQRQRCGIFLGTSSGDIAMHEQRYAAESSTAANAIAIHHPFHGDMAARLTHEFQLGGPAYTLSTACSASANALLYASWMIRQGRIDHALVLGVELQNKISLMGFNSMLLIARSGISRPFDVAREGIVLGEAIAATVLSSERTESTHWRLVGGASFCDASHPTNPAPEKIAETIQLALRDACYMPAEITAIKAHGTGTSSNDLGEALGMRKAFADQPPPFTSIKPVLGHTLGACGVLETLTIQRCLEQGVLPATTGFQQIDPSLGIAALSANQPLNPGPILLNFFGFGGNNCSLVMTPC